MMWLFMSRHARAQGGKTGLTLASLTNMGQLAPVIEIMTQTLGPESVKAFMLWIFNTVDTELARRIQAGPGTGEKKTEVRGQKTET